jgi:CheY-like chemotaxis protein
MAVEDEPGIYDVLLAMFEMWGIEGVAFVDGEEAIAWIDELDRSSRLPAEMPELALLDLRLPGPIQGEAVGARIRKSPHLKHIAIVLVTAYKLTVEEEAYMLRTAGADRLIYKPFPKFQDFKPLLESIIAQRRQMVTSAGNTSAKD